MTRFSIICLSIFVIDAVAGETVSIINKSGRPVDVWVREGTQKDFHRVIRPLWNNERKSIVVNNLPFKLAYTNTTGRFTYSDLYHVDPADGPVREIELTRRAIVQTKSVPRLFWDPQSRQFVERQQKITVRGYEDAIAVKGLAKESVSLPAGREDNKVPVPVAPELPQIPDK